MKDNQPSLAEYLVSQPWWDRKAAFVEHDRGHGRQEVRTLRVLPVRSGTSLPGFSSAKQMIVVTRERTKLDGTPLGKIEFAYAITSLPRQVAKPRDLARMLRSHWCIENGLHYVRDVTYDEDRSRIRTGSGPRVMASLRNIAIVIHRLGGAKNIASATRACSRDCRRAFAVLCGRSRRAPVAA